MRSTITLLGAAVVAVLATNGVSNASSTMLVDEIGGGKKPLIQVADEIGGGKKPLIDSFA